MQRDSPYEQLCRGAADPAPGPLSGRLGGESSEVRLARAWRRLRMGYYDAPCAMDELADRLLVSGDVRQS